MTLNELFETPQFTMEQERKEEILLAELASLTAAHRAGCAEYARVVAASAPGPYETLADLPYVPVSLFKSHTLRSIPETDVFKVMTSSGTTGQAVSRIYLDRTTAGLQSQALTAIMTRVLGPRRMPMLIVDTPNVVKNRAMFSARGAGVLGMMPFGRKHTYILDDDMTLDVAALRKFAEVYSGEPILIFGFTFMVWKYFLQALRQQSLDLDLSQAVLIHSGGWKKLADEAVGNDEFRAAFAETTGLQRIHNFYGMVEQTGSVFVEGADGLLYPPNFADVIIRDPQTWQPAPLGQPGVVEVLSVLPHSYPGHVLLTEDLGVIESIGTPQSGWSGRGLRILGRVPRSELRGCSDTHAYDRAS
jgi:acyl-CoA synthetase (AMP-forming)/AMP-acid ligase II